MSVMDTEYEESTSLNEDESSETSVKQHDLFKQFKRSVFMPFWKSPHLHKNSSVFEHFKHALRTLNGYDSDNIKRPFSFSPTWGLILQHYKIQSDFQYTLPEFLKSISYKKFLENKNTHTKKINLDRNYCAVHEAIKNGEDLNQIENRVGILDFPYFINILALLCVQASLKLHELSKKKAQDAKSYYNNTSPILDFFNNIHQRIHGKASFTNLTDNIKQTYRALEIIFNYTIRLLFEFLAFVITPFWDLAKLIIAPVILTITFPIWYPISCHLYKNQKAPLAPDNPPVVNSECQDSEDLADVGSLSLNT